MDDILPGGPPNAPSNTAPPFFKPDREEDCRVVWEIFQQSAKQDEGK
jgi:hypothetical protein